MSSVVIWFPFSWGFNFRNPTYDRSLLNWILKARRSIFDINNTQTSNELTLFALPYWSYQYIQAAIRIYLPLSTIDLANKCQSLRLSLPGVICLQRNHLSFEVRWMFDLHIFISREIRAHKHYWGLDHEILITRCMVSKMFASYCAVSHKLAN